ncbi:MAG: MBL fold metallo-hydrolase [Thermodesulfobacteriota bacterium]|nr:MBL fold metallo-hydrolase [Thermodesulfobacteriota bacterium]
MKKSATLSRKIANGIFSIRLPLTGDKPGPVNVYLFAGKNNVTLLDTGTAGAFGVLQKALAEHGMGCGDIDRIVLTHSHIDHYGSVQKILRAACRPVDIAGNFTQPVSIATGIGVSRQTMGAFLALMGVPLAVRHLMRVLSVVFSSMGESCEVTTRIQEPDSVEMGDYTFRVIETPGHTRDSICLYHGATGMLFSGDHVLPHITPNAFVMLRENEPLPRRLSQKEFYGSIEKVRALSPTVVYPAHGRAITDLEAVVRMYTTSYRNRNRLILAILEKGEQSIYQVARRLFPNLRTARLPLEIFLAVSEVYTHVQVLEEQGLVKTGPAGGVLMVSLPGRQPLPPTAPA